MKHLTLITALAFASSAIAQEPTSAPVPSPFNRVLLGLHASADQCYRILLNSTPSNSGAIAQWTDAAQPKFGYTAGLKVQYNFTPHWGFGIGAQYADRAYGLELSPHWVMIDPLDPSIPRHTRFSYHLSYIDIPVRLIFQAGRQRFRFTASMGVAGNLFLKASTVREVEYDDGHVVRMRMDGRCAVTSVPAIGM